MEAGEYLYRLAGNRAQVSRASALAACELVLQRLLLQQRFAEAGILMWGEEVFNPQPRSVAQVIDQWKRSRKRLVMGAGSQGKSFTVAALTTLDFRLDPLWTAVKVISQTKQHAKTNMFATIKRLLQDAAIPIALVPGETWLRVDSSDDRHGIMQVSIPKGESGVGVLKGFHPVPRKRAHRWLGTMSRVRAVIDEGEHVPTGVWTGVDNMLLSIDAGDESVAVVGVTNPLDEKSEFARRAEPADKPWADVDADKDFQWTSRAGYDVLRLDAKHSENVQQGRVVFQGFQTADGFQALIQSAGGVDTVAVWTLGRGMYPRQGATSGVWPSWLVDHALGGYVWVGVPRPVGSFDPALTGPDSAVLTVGLTGMATHWIDRKGEQTAFEGGPKRVVLAESQIEVAKGDSVIVAKNLRKVCQTLMIDPEALALDATGTTEGVASQLRHNWGEVVALVTSTAATERKVLVEDPHTADQRYVNLATELWFTSRFWAEHNLLKISPNALSQRLRSELTARRCVVVGKGKVRLRKKEEDQVGGKSPDCADSLTMIAEAARAVMDGPMATGREHPGRKPKPEHQRQRQAAERVEMIEFFDPVGDSDQMASALDSMWDGGS